MKPRPMRQNLMHGVMARRNPAATGMFSVGLESPTMPGIDNYCTKLVDPFTGASYWSCPELSRITAKAFPTPSLHSTQVPSGCYPIATSSPCPPGYQHRDVHGPNSHCCPMPASGSVTTSAQPQPRRARLRRRRPF